MHGLGETIKLRKNYILLPTFKNSGLISKLILLFLVNSFWLLADWPGTLSPDSIDTWTQIKSGHFSDWHPAMFQIYVKILSLNCHSIIFYTIIQNFLVTAVLYYFLVTVIPNIKKVKVVAIVGLCMLTPFFGQMSLQMWADLPYTIFTVLGISILIRNYEKKGKKSLVLSGIIMGFGSSFRHESIYILVVFCGFGLLFFSKKNIEPKRFKFSNFAIFTMPSLLLAFFLPIISVIFLHASPVPNWMAQLPYLHDVAYTLDTSPESIAPTDKKLIESVVTGKALVGAANCFSIEKMMFSEGFHPEIMSAEKIDIFALWRRNFPNAWKSYAYKHWCGAAAFLPPPLSLGLNPISEGDKWHAEWLGWGIMPNSFGLKGNPPSNLVNQIAYWWRGLWGQVGGLIAWPGLHLILAVLLTIYVQRKRIMIKGVWLYLGYVVLRDLFFILTGLSPGYRYMFITNFLSVPLIIIFILGWCRNELLTKTEQNDITADKGEF
jgi:hypothetical protein